MPEVCQSTSEVRIQVFTIDGRKLDCWNHPNMLSLKNRMGERKIQKKSVSKSCINTIEKRYGQTGLKKCKSKGTYNENGNLFCAKISFLRKNDAKYHKFDAEKQ